METKHKAIDHPPGTCSNEGSCMFCEGGLFGCAVCGGLEGGMPTHCPGEPMGYDREQEIYRGEIDFKNGEWIKASSIYSPASYRIAP